MSEVRKINIHVEHDQNQTQNKQNEPKIDVNKVHTLLNIVRLTFLIILLSVLSIGSWLLIHRNTSPVPDKIQSEVNFPIYYPNQHQLPARYYLDIKSFSSAQDVVEYTVRYNDNQRLIFTVQPKISDEKLNTFYRDVIPLHFNYQTPVGEAAISAITNKTLVSLPTNSKSWILVTGPADIDQNQLKQVLNSLKEN